MGKNLLLLNQTQQQLREQSFIVDIEEAGKRLDYILQQRFSRWSRSHWQRRIREGSVLLNQAIVRPASRLKAGEVVSYCFLCKTEPEVNSQIHIEYEDEDLALIAKPANLPVHPSGVYRKHTLYHVLKQRWGEQRPIRLVHRLDRETSGLLIVAKSKLAATRLNQDFQEGRRINKEYLVLVEGNFPDYYDAQGWLGPDLSSPVRKKRHFISAKADYQKFILELERSVLKSANSQPRDFYKVETCRTEFFCIGRKFFQGKEISLVRACLHSGRTHQIRASLCSYGYPVIGDRIYGVDSSMYLRFIHGVETSVDHRALRIGRTALHAYKLEFVHPTRMEPLSFSLNLPEDMDELWHS